MLGRARAYPCMPRRDPRGSRRSMAIKEASSAWQIESDEERLSLQGAHATLLKTSRSSGRSTCSIPDGRHTIELQRAAALVRPQAAGSARLDEQTVGVWIDGNSASHQSGRDSSAPDSSRFGGGGGFANRQRRRIVGRRCPAARMVRPHSADGQLLAGWVANHSFRIVLTRVCHPGPLARRAPTTSGSNE